MTHPPRIDRRALVARHTVVRTGHDPRSPIQVGNGEFAFNADITGLQTLLPHNILTYWAWHEFPPSTDLDAYQGREWETNGRPVRYPDVDPDHPEASAWLAESPHRLNLGRIGLAFDRPLTPADLTDCRQSLDLWTGILTSEFTVDGTPVRVTTAGHPDRDCVAVRVESALVETGRLGLFVDFPDGDPRFFADQVGDWTTPRRHHTALAPTAPGRTDLIRTLDRTTYRVAIQHSDAVTITPPVPAAHPRDLHVTRATYGEADVTKPIAALARNGVLALTVAENLGNRWATGKPADLTIEYTHADETAHLAIPYGAEVRLGDDIDHHRHTLHTTNPTLEATFTFTPADEAHLPTVPDTLDASAKAWPEFWNSGGAIDFSGSGDPRAHELERRVVLSQYLMRVNEAGSLPPQESGLVNNGWYGKFHFEMFLWHGAHWALWDRWPQLRPSLDTYRRLLPSARDRAREQGFAGARWPKCTGPDGRETPHVIHALLLWQQPNVFFFAELDYQRHPTPDTLAWWREILDETAAFLVSRLSWDEPTQRHILAPPMYVVSENTDPASTANPTFELAYWRFGLTIAQRWRERLGQPREPAWDDVLTTLADLPTEDGVYVLHEGVEDMWRRWTYEHPALTGVYGLLPGPGVDLEAMRATAKRVFTEWQFDKIWGWDFPMLALCAARLGHPELAVDTLLHASNGFQFTDTGLATGGPFPYFPSNGGLLYAVAMMCAGWPGAPDRPNPGFPGAEQGWTVRWEGLRPAL